jgi:hypothetical protein
MNFADLALLAVTFVVAYAGIGFIYYLLVKG